MNEKTRTIEQECDSLVTEALKGGEFVGITNDLALRLVGAIRTRDAIATVFDGEEEAFRAEVSRLEHVIALAVGRIERHEPGAALTGLRAGLAVGGALEDPNKEATNG